MDILIIHQFLTEKDILVVDITRKKFLQHSQKKVSHNHEEIE